MDNEDILVKNKYDVFRYVHKWTNEVYSLVFYTIPMIHVGVKEYYVEINSIINDLNHVLIEGVNIKKSSSELGKYRLLASEAKLEAQYDEIKIPDDIKVINIDMDDQEINKRIKKISLFEKFKIRTYKNQVKRLKNRTDLIDIIKEYCRYPEGAEIKLIDPKAHYQYKNKKKENLKMIIENERDDNFQEKLMDYFDNNKNKKFRMDIGILVGDNHMPAIYRTLESLDYKWKLYKKVYVM